MSKAGKKKRKLQGYRCSEGHFFNVSKSGNYTNSFVEFVVYTYLKCLSLNTTINIIRAYYEEDILSKATILSFLETVADQLPTLDDIDNLFHPVRSGYIALDGVWFKFRGMDIVMLVAFDPETFDVIEAHWSLKEDEKAYSDLLIDVGQKIGFNNIKGIYGDGDNGLMSSLKKHFPLVPFQLCVVHKEMRMGQLVPVKMVNRSKQMSDETKEQIREFQKLFRAVIYASTKKKSLLALKALKTYTDTSNQERFKKAYRSLRRNFNYSLTYFDHPGMMRDNNLIECFNGIIKPRLRLMKGFKKYQNLDRYLKLFLLEYRFHILRESRFEERRGSSPLELASNQVPKHYNFLTLLRKYLNLNYTLPSP
jgi:transposase-like protein